MDEVTYCSIGENCLTQGILDRHQLKSSIGPFSWARSNIDYILEIIDEDFANFLNPNFLQYRYRYNKQIATNSKYQSAQDRFDKSVANEFEFTHHDVIASESAIENFARKTRRFQQLLRSRDPIVFIYHHRVNTRHRDSLHYVVERLNLFAEIVRKQRGGRISVLCFTQKIILGKEERRVDLTKVGSCHVAVLYTNNIWAGTDPDIFWGKADDDLFLAMLGEFSCLNN